MQDAPTASAAQTCPHGLRPGTTVCLHCRQEARAAARQRRNRLLVKVMATVLGVGVVVALIIGGVMTITPDGPAQVVQTSGDAAAPATSAPASRDTRFQPILAEGRHELGDSMFAVREGDSVTVNFDRENLRTRFDWKFEGVVRATLPLLYGTDARVALDSIPPGTWVRGGALLTELPDRGVPLRIGEHTVRVWPVTRQGRDGPLVVGYRTATAR
jgi:hypothetical protein